MLFSTVIPACNRRDLLREALDSALAQPPGLSEVIVVDDGSTDGTAEMLSAYAGRVRVFRQENQGPGAARNRGLREARGEYIAFLDSDDLWFPWTLEVFRKTAEAQGRPAIVCGRLVQFHDPAELAAVTDRPLCVEAFPDYFASAPRLFFVGSGMAVFRREELLRAGGFLENRINCEDHDLVMRLGEAPGFAQVLAPSTLAWRRHDGACTTQFQRTLDGVFQLLQRERDGAYPGGPARAAQRHRILSAHLRPATLEALKRGCSGPAWTLYRRSLGWNLRDSRWRYAAAFPLLALAAACRGRGPSS